MHALLVQPHGMTSASKFRMTRAHGTLLLISAVAGCESDGYAPSPSDEVPSVPLVALFGDGVLYGIAADGRVFGGEQLRTPMSNLGGARSIAGRASGGVILGSAPDAYECASLPSGDVVCRGSNVDGDLSPIVSMTCDNPNNSCAPSTPDHPYCFRLFGPTSYPCVPNWTPLPGIRELVQIHGTCGVDRHGVLACWGRGAGEILPLPRPVRRLAGRFAIFDDGALYDRAAHAVVAGLANVVDVDGGDPACAVHEDGTLSCWGSNLFGQVGDGTTADRKEPATVGDGFTSIRMGLGSACGAMKDGGLSCWGTSGFGPTAPGIACGGLKCVASPTRIAGVTGVIQLGSLDLNGAPLVLTRDGRLLRLSNVFTTPIAEIVHP